VNVGAVGRGVAGRGVAIAGSFVGAGVAGGGVTLGGVTLGCGETVGAADGLAGGADGEAGAAMGLALQAANTTTATSEAARTKLDLDIVKLQGVAVEDFRRH
jgi:hypothetical protein